MAQQDKIYRIVEVMPRFLVDSCEGLSNETQKGDCGDKAFGKAITDNIILSDSIKNQGIVGFVLASFVVEKDGSISTVNITRSKGSEVDAAVINSIQKVAKGNFRAGRQRNKPVRVQLNLPVNFNIPSKKEN